MTAAGRYYVKDALHGQSLDLVSTGDRRRRERWLVIDSETNRDVDVFASKKAAADTARDLNSAPAPCACGEPEDGGQFGWFTTDDGTFCNACGDEVIA